MPISSNPKTVTTQDHEDVVAAVQKYVDGMRAGDPRLYDYVEKSGRAPEMHARVDVLAIMPTVAVVRVDIEQDANGANYTDFHSLLKQDERWVVIAKVFRQYGYCPTPPLDLR